MDRQRAIADRLAAASEHALSCRLCEHRCGVRRGEGARGKCGAAMVARVARHGVEYGEELDLVPSHVFYLSGCDLRCVFCIAELDAIDPSRGQELTASFFREAVAWGKAQGARNIQWAGGEPTVHLPRILEVMAACPDLPPVVWKSNFHGTPEAMDLLDGVVDVYLADLKFGDDACAAELSGISNYLATVTRNLRVTAARGRLIVRHLLLPGHLECCYRPIVQWMSQNLPDIEFSLRDGYLPRWRAGEFGQLGRPIRRDESRQAREMALAAGLRVIR